MISFLISIDKFGTIRDVKWSDPAYIVSVQNRSLFELFPDEEKAALYLMIEKCVIEDALFHCGTAMHLKGQTSKIMLCLLQMEGLILVFATDEKLSSNEELSNGFGSIVHKFMYVIKEYSKYNNFNDSDSTCFQFESIQTLNNELVNTRRMLEKSNAQLNVLNGELNNRLVKDALTGLVSRYQYRAEIEYVINKNPGKLGIFTFMDIDNFKSINDNYGHADGDKYLIAFAERLNKLPLDNTIRLRISGDEFGLFTYGLSIVEAPQIDEIWNQINNIVLSMPIEVESKSLPISISAVMAVYGVDTQEIYKVIEYADFAMYRAKSKGKRCFHVFDMEEYQRIKVVLH